MSYLSRGVPDLKGLGGPNARVKLVAKKTAFWLLSQGSGPRPVAGRSIWTRALARQLSRRFACRTPGLAVEQLATRVLRRMWAAVPDAVAMMERLRLLVEGVNNKIRVLQTRLIATRNISS